jgi:hypothetical protein
MEMQMDLNNKGLNYKANESLEYYVRRKEKESKLSVLFILFLCTVIGYGFYLNASLEAFKINLGVIVLIGCSFIYSAIVIESVKLNKIVYEIILVNKQIILITYDNKFFFYQVNSKRISINIEDFKLKEVDFPFNSSRLKTNKTYALNVNGGTVYICYECFSNQLAIELDRFLIS